ncbi:MAG: DNA polymerase, partial [bacterium]|nr:DNA polymerase [bacterium]
MDHPEDILAAELAGGNQIVLYVRGGQRKEPFFPWLLVQAPEDCDQAGLSSIREIRSLRGGGEFRQMVHFHTWSDFQEARGRLSEDGIPHFHFSNPVRQHLLLTGQTLFRNLRYDEVHRLQLDIETLSLDPQAPAAKIILISLSDNRGYEEILSGLDMPESSLLEVLCRRIQQRDPDVIEGHNIFDFDLAYINARAQQLNIPLTWGRDGSELRVGHGRSRFKVGGRNPGFRPAYVHGRHIIDTFQQVQRYDVGGKLESYGLKNAVRALGLERDDRTFVQGDQIGRIWKEDPERLIRYALDDVRDVRALSELVVPTEFYQTQILPYSFQETATSGPGEKINALMAGVYLRRGLAIPRPQPSRSFAGGYTRLIASGIFNRVVKADVQSLYPSIMLNFGIRPASDTENAFLPMLERLTKRRLDAKGKFQEASSEA